MIHKSHNLHSFIETQDNRQNTKLKYIKINYSIKL